MQDVGARDRAASGLIEEVEGEGKESYGDRNTRRYFP